MCRLGTLYMYMYVYTKLTLLYLEMGLERVMSSRGLYLTRELVV